MASLALGLPVLRGHRRLWYTECSDMCIAGSDGGRIVLSLETLSPRTSENISPRHPVNRIRRGPWLYRAITSLSRSSHWASCCALAAAVGSGTLASKLRFYYGCPWASHPSRRFLSHVVRNLLAAPLAGMSSGESSSTCL